MTWELVQHAVVTVAAIGAGGVLLREVAAFLWPRKGAAGCSQCSSSRQQSPKRGRAQAGEPVVLQIQGRRRS